MALELDIYLMGAILLFIPLIVQIRNYSVVKSKSYLYFASLFVFAITTLVIESVSLNHILIEFADSISFFGIYFMVLLIASEAVDSKLLISDILWKSMATISLTLTLLIKYLLDEGHLDFRYIGLRIAIGEFFRLLTGLLMIYAFYDTRLIIKTNRTKLIKYTWVLWGILITIIGFIRFSWFFLTSIDSFVFDFFNPNNYPSYRSFVGNVADLEVIMTLLIFLIALLFPESMLLSHTQLVKAAQLYDLIEEENKSKVTSRRYAPQALINYLRQLPKQKINKNEPEV